MNTKTVPDLNYSSLQQPVTEADIAAYRQLTGVKKAPSLWLLLAIAAVIIGIITLANSGRAALLTVLFWVAMVGGFLCAIYYGLRLQEKNMARLYRFAKSNSLQFVHNKQDPDYAGMIFNEGHTRVVEAAFILPSGVEIGNYQYVTGSGKNRSTHHWAYVKVGLPRKLPHMVLDAKKNNLFGKLSNLTDTFDSSQTLTLEGDFNDYFTLYAPKQYERDALYVFTPDVMARLIDSGSGFDMEVIDDELYIYRGNRFNLGSEAELRTLLGITSVIGTEFEDQTGYYADERVGDRTQNIIASPGTRLKHGANWIAICFVVVFVGGYVFSMLSAGSVFAALPGIILLVVLVMSSVFSILKRTKRQ